MRLQWAPTSENYMTYDEAVIYCQFLDHRDHKDWRMPTWEEYSSDLWRYGDLVWVCNPAGFAYGELRIRPVRNTTTKWEYVVTWFEDVRGLLFFRR